MSIEKRREREKEEMREIILSAANEIVASEGFDNLSIRKIANKIDSEVKAIIDEAYSKAEKILAENESKLHAVAQELLLKEKLEGADFEAIIARTEADEIVKSETGNIELSKS